MIEVKLEEREPKERREKSMPKYQAPTGVVSNKYFFSFRLSTFSFTFRIYTFQMFSLAWTMN